MAGNKSKILFKYYPEEHYFTVFNQENGFFIRKEEKGFPNPFWSEHGPELLDISITNFCTMGCSICYRDSNQNGKNISIENLRNILDQAIKMDVKQVALGGGNPNEHPDFVEILRIIRSEYDIIPSYTTNGNNLTPNIMQASKEYCGAVALSAHRFDEMFLKKLELLIYNQIKTNIHFILNSDSINLAIKLLEHYEYLPKGLNALIFLNYKPVGRNKSYNLLCRNSDKIVKFFELVNNRNYNFKIGFDSCFVSAIVKYTSFNPTYFDACEAGRFSAFIDENLRMFPCSFLINSNQYVSLEESEMKLIWQDSVLFNNFREIIKNRQCSCEKYDLCYGGCPVFQEINFCK